jgi:hypothetical protein
MKKTIAILLIIATLTAGIAIVPAVDAAPNQTPTNPGTAGLVSWWSMDETSGTRYDSYGTNNLTSNNSVGYGQGLILNSASFIRSNDQYLSVNNSSLAVGDIDFSIGMFVKLSSKNVEQQLFSKTVLGNNIREYYIEYYNVADKFYFCYSSNGTSVSALDANQTNIQLNTWYFIYAWHDATNNITGISVNDLTPHTANYSLGVYAGTAPLIIGKGISNTNDFSLDGYLDNVFFYKKVLTEDERAWIYNNGAGRSYCEVANNCATATPTVTNTATVTATPTITDTATSTNTSTPTQTATITETAVPTNTPTQTATVTETPTETATITLTPTITATATITSTPTITPTPSDRDAFVLSSGNYLTVFKSMTYGEIAVVTIVALALIILLIYFISRWVKDYYIGQ